MRYWMHYWRREDVDNFLRNPKFRVDCTGSDQRRFHTQYKQGDIVWFHSFLENREHVLLGRLILDQKMSKEDVSPHVGRPFAASTKFETYWVSEKPWLPIQTNVKINHIATELQFKPYKPLPPNYHGGFFQSIRRLTEIDHNLLQQEWDIWME